MAFSIHNANIVLGKRKPLFRRLAKPLHSLGIILCHAPTFGVSDSKLVLGNRIALAGFAPEFEGVEFLSAVFLRSDFLPFRPARQFLSLSLIFWLRSFSNR